MSKDDKKTTTPPAASSDKKSKPLADDGKLPKRIKLPFIGFLVILLALVGWVLIEQRNQDNIIFTIDGKNYTKKDIASDISYPLSTGTSEENAAATFYEYKKRQIAAQQANFEPTTQEISDAKKEVFAQASDKERSSRWADIVAYDTALSKKLPSSTTLDAVKGYIFVFYYGQLIQTGNDYTPANAGNAQLIAQDKAYAKQQADMYHKKLQDKSISPDELLAQINADPKLNFFNRPNNSLSMKLDPADTTSERSELPADINNYVTQKAPIGIGSVQVGRTYEVKDYKNPQDKKAIETYYYFTNIENKGTAAQTAQFNAILASLNSAYKGYKK